MTAATATVTGSSARARATSSATEDSETSTITASASLPAVTYASACTDMLDIFASCTDKIRGFTDLPYGEQAECYW